VIKKTMQRDRRMKIDEKMQQEEEEICRKKIKEERRRNGHGEKINGKAK